MFFKNSKKIATLENNIMELEKIMKKLEEDNKKLVEVNTHYEDRLEDLELNVFTLPKHEESLQEEEEYERCSCGGTVIPMYDEHPNWIKFCRSCDSRSENTEASPIREP